MSFKKQVAQRLESWIPWISFTCCVQLLSCIFGPGCVCQNEGPLCLVRRREGHSSPFESTNCEPADRTTFTMEGRMGLGNQRRLLFFLLGALICCKGLMGGCPFWRGAHSAENMSLCGNGRVRLFWGQVNEGTVFTLVHRKTRGASPHFKQQNDKVGVKAGLGAGTLSPSLLL